MAEFKDLVGKTLSEIKNNGDELIFIVDDGTQYKMYHGEDCCERNPQYHSQTSHRTHVITDGDYQSDRHGSCKTWQSADENAKSHSEKYGEYNIRA